MQIRGNTRQERFTSAVNALQLRFPVAEISEKTGYGKSTVSAYLKNREPSQDFIRRFCELYHIPFEQVWDTCYEEKSKPTAASSPSNGDKDKLIMALEKQVSLLEAQVKRLEMDLSSSLVDLKEYGVANIAHLETVLECLAKMRSKTEKVPVEKVKEEHRLILIAATETLLKEGKD